MDGQIQIKDYNPLTLLDKYQKKLECQVKSWYMQEHFAVKTDYNETEALQAYLFIDLYSNILENCELYKFQKEMNCCTEIEEIKLPTLKPCC